MRKLPLGSGWPRLIERRCVTLFCALATPLFITNLTSGSLAVSVRLSHRCPPAPAAARWVWTPGTIPTRHIPLSFILRASLMTAALMPLLRFCYFGRSAFEPFSRRFSSTLEFPGLLDAKDYHGEGDALALGAELL